MPINQYTSCHCLCLCMWPSLAVLVCVYGDASLITSSVWPCQVKCVLYAIVYNKCPYYWLSHRRQCNMRWLTHTCSPMAIWLIIEIIIMNENGHWEKEREREKGINDVKTRWASRERCRDNDSASQMWRPTERERLCRPADSFCHTKCHSATGKVVPTHYRRSTQEGRHFNKLFALYH